MVVGLILFDKIDFLIYGLVWLIFENGFFDQFVVYKVEMCGDFEWLIFVICDKICGVVVIYYIVWVDKDLFLQFFKIEMVVSFGVGYDYIDVKYVVEYGIIVINMFDVLIEEVVDVVMGLLILILCEFIKVDCYVCVGQW